MLTKPSISSREELYGWGSGIPFNLPQRYPVKRNDAERQRKMFIDLTDLTETIGMPNNFYRRADEIQNIDLYFTERVSVDINV